MPSFQATTSWTLAGVAAFFHGQAGSGELFHFALASASADSHHNRMLASEGAMTPGKCICRSASLRERAFSFTGIPNWTVGLISLVL